MSNRQFDRSDLDSVMEYAKKLEGLTMEEIFLRCDFARPTRRKISPSAPIRQFVYKEEQGDWHCDKKKGGCTLERETSEWYKKILDGDGKFLTKKELKIILNHSGKRMCRKCHDGKYYPVKVGGKCRICGESIQGNKGTPGNLVDCYFGYERKTDPEPDLVEVGVELKARPLVGNAKQASIKEPMSMNLIHWDKDPNDFKSEGDITKSSWYYKCGKMLLFYWEHTDSMFWEWKMKDVFLWKIDKKGIKDFEQDYRNIVMQMRDGVRCTDKSGKQVNDCKDKNNRNWPCKTGLHQGLNKYLTTCPKHSGNPPYRKRKTGKNSVKQPKSDLYGNAEIKAFRIKTGYELKILEMYRKNRPENHILVY